MLRMKGPSNLVVHRDFERATMNSRLARWLQTPFRRRLCAIGFIVCAIFCLAYLSFLAWPSVYDASEQQFKVPDLLTVVIITALVIAVLIVEQLLFMAIRPVLSFPDEAFDERQSALVACANAKARFPAAMFLMVLAVGGIAQVSPMLIGFLGVLFVVITIMTPHFVLAWTLPESREVETDYA